MHDSERVLHDVLRVIDTSNELDGQQRAAADVASHEDGECAVITACRRSE